ncbi:MAG: ABC transporter substrate-binding protein [Ilumatobacteraceae bacterium]
MSRHQVRSGLAIAAVATAVTMAACGSDSKSASSTAAATATTATTAGANTTAGSTGGSTATTAGASTTAGSTPSGGKYGLIDGVYEGAGDFTLDPADCPSDWNPKQGLTDSSIELFMSLPTSGPLAGFGLIADGAKSYFQLINEQGGIGGRSVNLTTKDDGYQPDKTKTNTEEALGANAYAAFDAMLGTANNLAIWDQLNDECMPHLFVASGAPNWGDVENHPWTIGLGLDYFTESVMWARWLQAEHPELKTVAEVTFNNDFGQVYHRGFAYATTGTDIEVVKQETHEATAPNLDNQFTTLAATNADVLLIETSGAFCTQAMAAVEKQTSWHPLVIMSATCASLNQYFKPLIDQGLTGKDTYMVISGKDILDPDEADNPLVKLYDETTTAQGLDPKLTTYFTGWTYAWFTVETLKLAATYEGGLDRGNIMLAARNLDLVWPLAFEGLTARTDGMKDAYVTEGGRMVQYKVTDPKQLGTLEPAGDVVNLEGQLGTYATVESASVPATGATTTGG